MCKEIKWTIATLYWVRLAKVWQVGVWRGNVARAWYAVNHWQQARESDAANITYEHVLDRHNKHTFYTLVQLTND